MVRVELSTLFEDFRRKTSFQFSLEFLQLIGQVRVFLSGAYSGLHHYKDQEPNRSIPKDGYDHPRSPLVHHM